MPPLRGLTLPNFEQLSPPEFCESSTHTDSLGLTGRVIRIGSRFQTTLASRSPERSVLLILLNEANNLSVFNRGSVLTEIGPQDWQEFAELDLKQVHKALRHPIVIDGRNMFPCEDMRAAGFHYYSMGRPTIGPGGESNPSRDPSRSSCRPGAFPHQPASPILRRADRSDEALG